VKGDRTRVMGAAETFVVRVAGVAPHLAFGVYRRSMGAIRYL
jgi:hypothetical protein